MTRCFFVFFCTQMMVTVVAVTMHSGDTSQSDDENKLMFIVYLAKEKIINVSCEGKDYEFVLFLLAASYSIVVHSTYVSCCRHA
jgi:hypothetical protein